MPGSRHRLLVSPHLPTILPMYLRTRDWHRNHNAIDSLHRSSLQAVNDAKQSWELKVGLCMKTTSFFVLFLPRASSACI